MTKLKLHLLPSSRLVRHYSRTPRAPPAASHEWTAPLQGHDTGIRVYNCAAKRKVPLVLPNENFVSWYTCGPTVYDSAHLGHASCYVKLDILQRILRGHFNLNVVSAMNVTDIDDKIIRKSQESGRDWREISKSYEAEFWRDLRSLNVVEPNLKIRVTENIPKIVQFIENIIHKGFAYVGKDRSVYFALGKYPLYGKLQKLSTDMDGQQGVGVANKLTDGDFALWKAKKTADEPCWPSPWGEGRPGWHIECSTLASMVFGDNLDFHAGGLDLCFPHHENEEAQSCVYHNKVQWVNYWLHSGQLSVKGDQAKMSKSLKNTIAVEEMLRQYTADEFRMACLLSNYRNAMDYGDEVMQTARGALNKFKAFKSDCQAYLMGKKCEVAVDSSHILSGMNFAKEQVDACLKDDFDTARSISVLMDHINGISRCINASGPKGVDVPVTSTASSLDTIAAVDNFVQQTLRIYGLNFAQDMSVDVPQANNDLGDIDLNCLLEDLLESRKLIRDRAMASKSQELFRICDELRQCLQQHGIVVKDHSKGSSWSFNKK